MARKRKHLGITIDLSREKGLSEFAISLLKEYLKKIGIFCSKVKISVEKL